MSNLRVTLRKFIRSYLRIPFGEIPRKSTQDHGMELAEAFNQIDSPVYKLVCDNTNNSLENIREGRINVTVVLKFDQEVTEDG